MLRIGLIGMGYMGQAHEQGYNHVGNARITAVCDRNMDKASSAAQRWGAQAFTSIEAMLEQGDIDAVDICLPTDSHRKVTEMAASRGKHVLCEKPIALNPEDAQAMIQACRKAGVVLMVGHLVRFIPEFAAVRRQIQEGKIGKLGVARTIRSGAFPDWKNWYADYARSGGPLLDLAIHDFDYLRWCCGPVRRVFSRMHPVNAQAHTLTLLRFESGAMAHVEASWAYPPATPFQQSMEFAGSEGLIELDRSQYSNYTLFNGPDRPVLARNFSKRNVFAYQLEHFASCALTGQTPLVTGEEALETLKVSLAAIESAASNRAVNIGGKE